jgi:hypothetical protein
MLTNKVISVDNIWNYEYYSFPDVWGNVTLKFLYCNTLVQNWGTEYTSMNYWHWNHSKECNDSEELTIYIYIYIYIYIWHMFLRVQINVTYTKLDINIHMWWKGIKQLYYAPVFHFSLFCSLDNIWYFLPIFTTHWRRGSVKIM